MFQISLEAPERFKLHQPPDQHHGIIRRQRQPAHDPLHGRETRSGQQLVQIHPRRPLAVPAQHHGL